MIGVQCLMWTIGGGYFSITPIAKVRGETERPAPPALNILTPIATPGQIPQGLAAANLGAEVRSITLRLHLDEVVCEIAYVNDGHIMDYENRDNFNTLLLQVLLALGLATVLSGFALFLVTSPRLRRRSARRAGVARSQ